MNDVTYFTHCITIILASGRPLSKSFKNHYYAAPYDINYTSSCWWYFLAY